jgi:hypothetical protein
MNAISIITVFWNNADNFVGVIVRDTTRTTESQVEEYIKTCHSGMKDYADQYYGVEIDAIEL